MIGNEMLTVNRPYKYLYSGTAGTNKTPVCQPPAKGCYMRIETTGTPGTVKAYGTVGGVTTTETVSSYDTHGIGLGSKKFTAITKFDVTGFTSVTIYPANESKEKMVLTETSTFTILGDVYAVNVNQTRGQFIEIAGKQIRAYKQILYDGRFELQIDDKVSIRGREYTVFDLDEYALPDTYMAFCAIMR